MKLHVGILSCDVTEDDLRRAFEPFGKVSSVTVLRDKLTGVPRGFGFVEMPTKAKAEAAIAGLTGKELKGETLKVSEARPRPEYRRGDDNRGERRRF